MAAASLPAKDSLSKVAKELAEHPVKPHEHEGHELTQLEQERNLLIEKRKRRLQELGLGNADQQQQVDEEERANKLVQSIWQSMLFKCTMLHAYCCVIMHDTCMRGQPCCTTLHTLKCVLHTYDGARAKKQRHNKEKREAKKQANAKAKAMVPPRPRR